MTDLRVVVLEVFLFYWLPVSICAPIVDKVFLTQQEVDWFADFVKNVLFQLTGGCLTTTVFVINVGLSRLLFGSTEYTDAGVSLIKFHLAPFGKTVRQKVEDPRVESDECDWCAKPVRLTLLFPFFLVWVTLQISLFFVQLCIAFGSILTVVLFPFGFLHAEMASQMTGKYYVSEDFPPEADQVYEEVKMDISSAAVDHFLSNAAPPPVQKDTTKMGEKNDAAETTPLGSGNVPPSTGETGEVAVPPPAGSPGEQ